MSVEKYYVALDAAGHPVAQRTTLRNSVYQSANAGGSFSSKKISKSHPLRVVEVPRAVEWIARATLEDGTKVSQRSRSTVIGRNYLLYSYTIRGTSEHRENVVWTNKSRDEWATGNTRDQVLAFAEGSLEIRHWPTPGNSVVV